VALDRKDVFQGSKILVDFLRDFTFLTEQQLMSVRKMMEAIVMDVMDSITKMNGETNHKKGMAKEVLIREGDSGSRFVSTTLDAVEKRDESHLEKDNTKAAHKHILENRLLRNSGIYSKHLEAVSRLDADLQSLISRVIGSVSADDVIAQRLNHIILSLQFLQAEMAEFLVDHKAQCTPGGIKAFRNRVLTQVYRSYTAEEEKEIFHRVFGQPRDAKKAG
jgi:hypothetical protein